MSLLTLIVTILVVGILLYAVDKYAPMEGQTKRLLKIVVICVLVLWLLQAFGILDAISSMNVPKVHR